MSGLTMLALYFPRYLMVAGFAVLALVYLTPEFQAMGPDILNIWKFSWSIEKYWHIRAAFSITTGCRQVQRMYISDVKPFYIF